MLYYVVYLNKLGGVAAIALVFIALLALPFINTSQIRSSNFRPIHKKLFWLLVADCLILIWIGQQPVEDPYIFIGQCASVYFFVYFLICIPFLGKFEKFLISYKKTDYSSEKINKKTGSSNLHLV